MSMGEIEMNLLNEVMEKQRNFFLAGETKSIAFRINKLKSLKQEVLKYQNEIIFSIEQDFGVSNEFDGLSRIMLIVEEINNYIKNLKKWAGPVKVKTPLTLQVAQSSYVYEPLGCVLIIGAWNAPYSVILLPLIASIGAGNCTLIKPSELAPNCSSVIFKIINLAFQSDFCAVVEGGVDKSKEILKHKFDYICYTGSTRIGKIVYQAAAEHLTPVLLELGGKTPYTIDEIAKTKLAAKRIC